MTRLEQIEMDVVNYFGGCGAEGYTDEQTQIMAIYNREWDNVEVDPEGPNAEQDKELDDIIERCAKEVFALENTKKLFITNGRERDIVRYSETSDQKDAFEISENDFLNLLLRKYASRSKEQHKKFIENVKKNSFKDWIQY